MQERIAVSYIKYWGNYTCKTQPNCYLLLDNSISYHNLWSHTHICTYVHIHTTLTTASGLKHKISVKTNSAFGFRINIRYISQFLYLLKIKMLKCINIFNYLFTWRINIIIWIAQAQIFKLNGQKNIFNLYFGPYLLSSY